MPFTSQVWTAEYISTPGPGRSTYLNMYLSPLARQDALACICLFSYELKFFAVFDLLIVFCV